MPISKVPIVHKFGIISHSQRLELQERLLKQTYLQSVQSQKGQVQSRYVYICIIDCVNICFNVIEK